jgi:hypothetical protein
MKQRCMLQLASVEWDERELPVVAQENPDRITFVISRKDIVMAYHDEMERLKKP